MKHVLVLRLAIASAAAAVLATPAWARDLPPIKIDAANPVPACATPGRMMAFLKARNKDLDDRFEKIAVAYMRQGEQLGVRWDYAFAQMAIETNYLTFRAAGGRRGDVSPRQNNFAGLGATGRGEPGESFKDVETGVRAHLQHLLHYAGDEVAEPVAERTRKIMEWGVLKSFHARIKGPVTFKHLSMKWATSARYAEAIRTHADIFYSDYCNIEDPAPEQVAEARGVEGKRQVASLRPQKHEPRARGVELARKAIEDGKAAEDNRRVGLGGPFTEKPAESRSEGSGPSRLQFTVLNAFSPNVMNPERKPADDERAKGEDVGVIAPSATVKPAGGDWQARSATPKATLTASAGNMAAKALKPHGPGSKCRVWTASYGGQKAVIIRSHGDGATNYTVLDVNEGAEKREAEAYIAAYAKGGVIAAEFPSQTQAIDKAFEICPEG